MNSAKLLLASQSPTRQLLLREAQIPFVSVGHSALEVAGTSSNLDERVMQIAHEKVEAVIIPDSVRCEGCSFFVLSADTLVMDGNGKIYGKPRDRAQAFAMLKAQADFGSIVSTGFCCRRCRWEQGGLIVEQHIEQAVSGRIMYAFSDDLINRYLDALSDYRGYAGALTLEGYGAQFVREIHGSYTGLLGLPLVEVREALKTLGFWRS